MIDWKLEEKTVDDWYPYFEMRAYLYMEFRIYYRQQDFKSSFKFTIGRLKADFVKRSMDKEVLKEVLATLSFIEYLLEDDDYPGIKAYLEEKVPIKIIVDIDDLD